MADKSGVVNLPGISGTVWVIPIEGAPQALTVEGAVHDELTSLGFRAYHLERFAGHGGAEDSRIARVYSNLRPEKLSYRDWQRASLGLFGPGGAFRVFDDRGRTIVP